MWTVGYEREDFGETTYLTNLSRSGTDLLSTLVKFGKECGEDIGTLYIWHITWKETNIIIGNEYYYRSMYNDGTPFERKVIVKSKTRWLSQQKLPKYIISHEAGSCVVTTKHLYPLSTEA
jgi:hypothetical protein